MIVKTIVAPARNLKLQIIALGVEHVAQYSLLKGLGCEQYQGYYFSRPVIADDIARLLREDMATAS